MNRLRSLVALALLPAAAFAQHNDAPAGVPLHNSLIEAFKNRGTLRDIDSFLSKARGHANGASKFADSHAAARADALRLPAGGVPAFQILDIGTLGGTDTV